MPILSTDIKFLLSWGNSNIDPNAALGWIISTTEVTNNTLNNLFDDVSWSEHAAGSTNYRCVYVKNGSAETAYNVRIYIQSNTTAIDDTINIGKDLAWVGNGTSTWVADTILNESTAPDPVVTFTTAVDYANAITLWTMTAGQVYWVWIKRIVSSWTTSQANNTAVLNVSLDN